LEMFWAVILSH